jgi:hypothetical protein
MDEVTNELGIEIILKDPEDFNIVKETLTRIGVASSKDKKLFQSCCILHKRGTYSLMHFKEMFILDGKPSSITNDDIERRNLIAHLLHEWGLCDLVDETKVEKRAPLNSVKIIAFSDKEDWVLVQKYTIGGKRK